MFFFFLIVACLSISQDNLQPINSKMPSSNLVSIAKTDPLALVKMLDGANPDAIKEIVAILNGIIADGKKEIAQLDDAVKKANAKVAAIKKRIGELLRLEGEALSELQRRQRIEAVAKGRYNAALLAYNRAAPGLKNEIAILDKVLGMLQTLLKNNTPTRKELLELGSTEKGKAYLKLVANVQADPDKLRKIIGFVGTLLDGAKTELARLNTNVGITLKALNAAAKAREVASAEYTAAVNARKAAQNELAKAVGARDAAEKAYNTRSAILKKEEKTLKQVIGLLQSTADK